MSRLYELEKQLKEAKEELEKMGMSGCGPSGDMGGSVNGAMSKKEDKKKKKMDPVGQEDEDIDNDGDVDSSDEYLKNRRKKISESMDKGEDCEDMVEEKIEEHEKEKHSAKGHKKEHDKIKGMAKSAREEMLIHLAKSACYEEIAEELHEQDTFEDLEKARMNFPLHEKGGRRKGDRRKGDRRGKKDPLDMRNKPPKKPQVGVEHWQNSDKVKPAEKPPVKVFSKEEVEAENKKRGLKKSYEEELVKYSQNGQWSLEKTFSAGMIAGQGAANKQRAQKRINDKESDDKTKANFNRIIKENPHLELDSSKDHSFKHYHERVGGSEKRNKNLWDHQSDD